MKYILIFSGSLSVVVGVIGIFVPILPTTPFLLLAAACYIKSSDKLYNKLINNRYLGAYIQNYREKNGMTLKAKIINLVCMWTAILSSAFFATDKIWLRVLLILIATIVTRHLVKINTVK